jgi:outer membrane biosynthesis protein TonB
MLLCLRAARHVDAQWAAMNGNGLSEAQFQAITSTFFIALDRSMLVTGLPSGPMPQPSQPQAKPAEPAKPKQEAPAPPPKPEPPPPPPPPPEPQPEPPEPVDDIPW